MKTLIWHVIAVKLGTLKRFHEVIPNPFKVLVRTDDISFCVLPKNLQGIGNSLSSRGNIENV